MRKRLSPLGLENWWFVKGTCEQKFAVNVERHERCIQLRLVIFQPVRLVLY